MSLCPECNAQLHVSADVRIGEVLTCSDCQVQLEVISQNPLELVLAPEVEEDWGE